MSGQIFISCPNCDLLHRRSPLPPRGVAMCCRCRAMLYRRAEGCLDITLALALSGIICFLIANFNPFLALSSEGRIQETVLLSGVIELFRQGLHPVAILVLATGFFCPLVVLVGLSYILIPLKLGYRAWGIVPLFRLVRLLQPWAMMEVFFLGILVAMVKLIKMAQITSGIGLYAFLALVILLTAIAAALHPECIWERLPVRK